MTTYYKVLNENGTAPYLGGQWHLPTGNRPGKWMPHLEGELIPYAHGYHVFTANDLIPWLGPTIWEVEVKGKTIREGSHTIVRQARLLRRLETWNERTARLFTIDCAEHVLHIFEDAFPNQKAPRKAIEVARRYANDRATDEERTAALAAARTAYWSAQAPLTAAHAAGAASFAAVRGAARSGARDAARCGVQAAATERPWQVEQLMKSLNGEVS